MAKAAVRAGLSWSPDRQLPVQGFVAAHERARLVFHARRELPRVTAVASQVMVVDSRLAEAEETLERAVQHRLSMAAVAPSGAADGSATPATGGHAAEQPYQPTFGVLLEQPSRRQVLGPWSQAAVLAVVAGGQGLLASVVGRDLGLGPPVLGLFGLVGAVGVVAAAQLAARGIDRFGAAPDRSQHPDRRRWLEVAVAGGALACGVMLAVAIGYVSAGAGRITVGLALLGLATAVSYAAIPDRRGATLADRWQAVVARLRRLRQDRRARRRLRAALAREAAAQATARNLREQLAVLVPQLLPPSRPRCCSGAARPLSGTPHSMPLSSTWPRSPCGGPGARGGRSGTGGLAPRRRCRTPPGDSPRSGRRSRNGVSRSPRSPWQQSGSWSGAGCSTSLTGCGCHRCPPSPPPSAMAARSGTSQGLSLATAIAHRPWTGDGRARTDRRPAWSLSPQLSLTAPSPRPAVNLAEVAGGYLKTTTWARLGPIQPSSV
jgi:hypothetical protein